MYADMLLPGSVQTVAGNSNLSDTACYIARGDICRELINDRQSDICNRAVHYGIFHGAGFRACNLYNIYKN